MPAPVSLIVLTWNGRRWLDDCLMSILALDPPAQEVWVVDNASTDGSVDYVRATYPGVRVVALDRNVGFAAGNNAGARDASAKYLAFLNNDTRVRADWLSCLVAPAEADPSVGLVSSRVVFMDPPGRIDSAGDGYLRCGGAFKHGHGQLDEAAPPSREVFSACGAAFLIRRDLFAAIGGFDEDFFMVYEDVDLSYRARLRGARCLYAGDAVVWHAGSASLGRVSASAVFYGQRNLEWTWLKNSPPRLLWRSLVSHLVYDMAGAVGYARRGQLATWCRAKWSALRQMPRLLRKRRAVQREATVDPEVLWKLMDADWVSIKRREKAFDFGAFSRSREP
jgi:GT2 family glycosyltransferase